MAGRLGAAESEVAMAGSRQFREEEVEGGAGLASSY